MKVILFGATGYIGGHVLAAALADTRITQLFVVSRRALPDLDSNDKVKVILLEDFSTYPPATISALASTDACLWCLGTYDGAENVEIEYPKAFFEAVTGSREWKARSGSEAGFRFVYLGGALTETDQSKSLWYYQTARRVRGRAQTMVLGWDEDERAGAGGKWKSTVMRAGAVMLPKSERTLSHSAVGCLMGDWLSVSADELARVMVEAAMGGKGAEERGSGRLMQNREIVTWGRDLIAK